MRQAFVEFMQSVGAKQDRINPFYLKSGLREHLTPGTTLHVLRDNLGKIFAYPTREEALAYTSPEMEGKPVRVSFQSLLKDDPSAFVHIESQYYWAKDLQM